ncbi:MAG: (2Fe-2S)-binding protein [Tissierellales bacterium]|jgi:bacterioferritin-associated ferredoxin|nr:(2Fe-2S)-binding protein [Tissierellales bacterium]
MTKEENTIVCRCSDVTLKELRDLIAEGYTDYNEIKRITRIGMGPCQGKTCTQIVLRELSQATGKPVAEIKNQNNRPPVVGVKLKLIAEEAKDDE